MKELGEQWIDKDGNMQKCIWTDGNAYTTKDLGPVNEDGCLPCPFCGEYPVVENAYEGCGYTPPDGYWRVYCSNDNHEISISSGKRRQESIDAWNRRA